MKRPTSTRPSILRPSFVAVLGVLVSSLAASTSYAFVVHPRPSSSHHGRAIAPADGSSNRSAMAKGKSLNMVFNRNNKKKDEDLSYIETRDMTPDEMRALNAKNEDIMNAELAGMTIFSLILSIPMLYLVWVGFFSETANVVDDALPY